MPGIALSAAQLAQLTSDIVWLVEQDVVLADGSTTRALVPQLYVRPRDGSVTGAGSLIAGRTVDIQITGDLSNGSAGVGVTVSASVARGHGNGQSTSYTNTRIDAANVTIDSGGDTTLKGAVVQANSIRADIGGNLRIESLQDTASYTEKQTSAGASVTVGAGGGGSVNVSQSRINSVYASVSEQSGLKTNGTYFGRHAWPCLMTCWRAWSRGAFNQG